MLIVHHLGHSQSERIVWLCEELGIPYELKTYARDPVTILSPPELRAVHPMGAAPVITEGNLVLAESAAIMEYLLAKYDPKHGDARLSRGPADADFADYLYWFHFANGNLQSVMGRSFLLRRLALPADNPVGMGQQGRLDKAFGLIEARLGEAAWLAGPSFTAADIITVFSLTTMRLFMPVDLAPYPNILAYLQRVGARPAYRAAMAKGDPDLVPMLT